MCLLLCCFAPEQKRPRPLVRPHVLPLQEIPMNQNQLKYFVAAAETRSFTKAAEQFYISQTAITQQIRQLESSLGCVLFDRSTRPVTPDAGGENVPAGGKGHLGADEPGRSSGCMMLRWGSAAACGWGIVRGYERSDLSVLMQPVPSAEQQCAYHLLPLLHRCAGGWAAPSCVRHYLHLGQHQPESSRRALTS